MILETAIRTMLRTDAAVAAIVSDRIFIRWMPERAAFPAITFALLSEQPIRDVEKGHTGTFEATIEVSAWAREGGGKSAYVNARDLQRAVRKALVGKTFRDATIIVQAITEEQTIPAEPDLDAGIEQFDTTFAVIFSEE